MAACWFLVHQESRNSNAAGRCPDIFSRWKFALPAGAAISVVAVENNSSSHNSALIEVAMMIGPVYRLRVTNIPQHEGDEVYPTVEVINRLYPPMRRRTTVPDSRSN